MAEAKYNCLDRHCAFCLKFLPTGTWRVCGKCHRRAYCSRDCQKADWSQNEGSQGHRNWCDLGCGEEDIDWEVKPVPGKGLGVIAKHLIPAKYRIMIDAARQHSHPAIMDLAPIGGTLEQKIALNELGCNDKPSVLCLRISRVNHDCDRNASHIYDSNLKVKILISEREIQPDEEITICYMPFSDVSYKVTSTMARTVLQQKWGIVCKVDCFCRNEEVQKLVQEARFLDEEISKALLINDANVAMQMVKRLLEVHTAIHSSWISKVRTLYDGFQVGITRKSTMNEGKEFLRRAYKLSILFDHPKSEKVSEMERYMKNPAFHLGYLGCE